MTELFWKGSFLQKHITRIEFIPLDEMTLEDFKKLDFENLTQAQKDRIVELVREEALAGFYWNEYTDHKTDELPPDPEETETEEVIDVEALLAFFAGTGLAPTAANLIAAPVTSERRVMYAQSAPRRQGLRTITEDGIVDEGPGIHGGKKDYYFPAESGEEKSPEDFYDDLA